MFIFVTTLFVLHFKKSIPIKNVNINIKVYLFLNPFFEASLNKEGMVPKINPTKTRVVITL